MSDEGFILTDLTGDRRRILALTVLRARLQMAIRFGRTDSFALQAARGWAAKEDSPPKRFTTMKQALAWVEQQIDDPAA